jgi:hypothetical protein
MNELYREFIKSNEKMNQISKQYFEYMQKMNQQGLIFSGDCLLYRTTRAARTRKERRRRIKKLG